MRGRARATNGYKHGRLAALIMRFSSCLKWAGVGALLLTAVGSATAQPGVNGASTSSDGQLGFAKGHALTPQEAAEQAATILARLDQAASSVRHQLDAARKQRDIVKSLCLSDKLSQIDAAARSCRDRKAALQAAVQRNDVELSNHEFTIMSVLGQRGNQLVAESNQCLGQDMSFVGQTEVSAEVSGNLPAEGEMESPGGAIYVIVPPLPLTSPQPPMPPPFVSPVK
jgi:hypothetical protein